MKALRRYIPLFSVVIIALSGILTAVGKKELGDALLSLGSLLPGGSDTGLIIGSTAALVGAIFKLVKVVRDAWILAGKE